MLRAFKDFREHLHEAHEHRRELKEIDALDDRALDEIGLSRSQLREIVETPDAVAARMTAMARRHGLDPEAIEQNRQDYAHLLDTCAHCHATGQCAAYLADQTRGTAAAGFCPNHADYLALQENSGA